jgi:hypothetical protein
MIGSFASPIEQNDIMYQDDLVCILRPEIKKGIIIWSRYTQPPETDSLCILGLKTGKQLHTEGVNFNRKIYHPYIFFRAPYYSRPIDYSTIETEIASSFGEIDMRSKVFIRVDPDQTFVFSSEIRTTAPTPLFHIDGHLISKNSLSKSHSKDIMKIGDTRLADLNYSYYNAELEKSKKTLSQYLTIIKEDEMNTSTVYNLYSSRKVVDIDGLPYPFNRTPIERNSEILVSIPHLTPEYFVFCT